MAAKKGSLSISSENIFPIIKNGYIPITIFSHVSWYPTDVMQSQN